MQLPIVLLCCVMRGEWGGYAIINPILTMQVIGIRCRITI